MLPAIETDSHSSRVSVRLRPELDPAAMPAGSRLVLVETLIGPRDSDPLPASVDVHMLTQCDGGRQRSAAELHALCSAAGLRPGGVHETGGPALVEALA